MVKVDMRLDKSDSVWDITMVSIQLTTPAIFSLMAAMKAKQVVHKAMTMRSGISGKGGNGRIDDDDEDDEFFQQENIIHSKAMGGGGGVELLEIRKGMGTEEGKNK